MTFAFIRDHRNTFPVKIMCRVLEVSPSGFYAWLTRPPSARTQRTAALVDEITATHEEFEQRYGSPRVFDELRKRHVRVSRNTVAKLMRDNGLRARSHRRFRPQTTDADHDLPVAPNLLDQQFKVETLDTVWTSDITYIRTDQGFLYLSCVMDLCSRKIVGWSMADHLRAELVVDALQAAIRDRRPKPGLMVHSDRGVQYACREFREVLDRHRITQSMSGKGNCYDNAPMESFWSRLKAESLHHERFHTREEARAAVFEYIEMFYNRRRSHSSLGYLSPEQFEASRMR
jgi:transposase InsO family protein